MERYDVFCVAYNNVSQIQFNTNVAYFQNKFNGLDSDYLSISDNTRFVAHHEIEPFESKWLKIIKKFNSLNNIDAYKHDISEFDAISRIANAFKDCKYNYDSIRKSNNSLYVAKVPLKNASQIAVGHFSFLLVTQM